MDECVDKPGSEIYAAPAYLGLFLCSKSSMSFIYLRLEIIGPVNPPAESMSTGFPVPMPYALTYVYSSPLTPREMSRGATIPLGTAFNPNDVSGVFPECPVVFSSSSP